MATYKIISELDAHAGIALTDVMEVQTPADTVTKKTTLTLIKALLFGGKTVGGTGAGDIMDIDSAQTATNKRFTSPKLNENVAITSLATDVNILAGAAAAGVTPTEFQYLNGVTSAIQTQINALTPATWVSSRPDIYYETWTNAGGVTTKTITGASIVTALLPAGYNIAVPCQIQLYLLTTDEYTVEATATYKITRATSPGATHLESIAITGMTAGLSYGIAVTFLRQPDGL
jgi:hypothetical protein